MSNMMILSDRQNQMRKWCQRTVMNTYELVPPMSLEGIYRSESDGGRN